MALDAGPFMRLGTRGSPSWPGFDPETGYVDADSQIRSLKPLADGAGHTLPRVMTRIDKRKNPTEQQAARQPDDKDHPFPWFAQHDVAAARPVGSGFFLCAAPCQHTSPAVGRRGGAPSPYWPTRASRLIHR